MRHIDKSPKEAEGRGLTHHYISTHCKVQEPGQPECYQNVSYSDFCSNGYADQMMGLIKSIQGRFCCYCMRDMYDNDGDVTLEHVIPQNATDADWSKYRALGIPAFDGNVVIRDTDFRSPNNQQIPPYPHTVSYDNFMNSCDGKFPDKVGSSQCCNNKRGNDYAIPVPYYEWADHCVDYNDKGEARATLGTGKEADVEIFLSSMRLRCKNLQHVRRMWYLLRNVNIQELIDCLHNSGKRHKLLCDVLFKDLEQIDIDGKLLNEYQREDYWRTFLSYYWFKDYYLRTYPVV